jgi:hypothetical protein
MTELWRIQDGWADENDKAGLNRLITNLMGINTYSQTIRLWCLDDQEEQEFVSDLAH